MPNDHIQNILAEWEEFIKPSKRWCKFSKEAEKIGYHEDRDGVIVGESRDKTKWWVKWGGLYSQYPYEKDFIEELDKKDIKSFLESSLISTYEAGLADAEKCVPKEKIESRANYGSDNAFENMQVNTRGFNSCRTITLEGIKKLKKYGRNK